MSWNLHQHLGLNNDSSGPETQRIKRDIADSLTSSMQKHPIIPTITSLVSMTDCYRLFYFSDEVLSSVREVILKSGISLYGAVVTQGNTAEIETIARLKAILKLAEQDNDSLFIKIDVDTLIDAFKGHPILAETPDILNIIADERNRNHWHFHTGWLSECKVLKDGDEGFDFPANLYIPTITDLAYLPIDKMRMVSDFYNEDAIDELVESGLMTCLSVKDLETWITSKELSKQQCIDLIRYLSIDNRYLQYYDVRLVIQGRWIPYNNSYKSPKEISEITSDLSSILGDSYYCVFLGIIAIPHAAPAHPSELKQIDIKAVLARIHDWWKEVREGKNAEYNRLAYPDGNGLMYLNEDDSSINRKSDWLKLFMLGSLHAMGRSKPEQHREYLSKCVRADIFNMEVSVMDRENGWLRAAFEIIDNPKDDQKYYHWIGFTAVRFLQLNRWLDDYISMFLDIEKYKDSFNIERFLKPRSNSIYSGTGALNAPPLDRTFGSIGVNYVLRELVRHGSLSNSIVFQECFVPTRRIKELFYWLSNGTVFESSAEIMEFLSENMPGMDATFGRCFDIPFQMILRDDELRDELFLEDLYIEMEEEDDI